nr:hypothetical protein [Tanacetum cinerariifolium]GEY12457.1 hypothetical protein [Tanacetum cinerariifolium]
DIYKDNALSSAGIIGIKNRHNVMRDTLIDICYRSGISAGKEIDIGLDEEDAVTLLKVFMGDIYGDHAMSCAGIVGIKHRQNVVRDTFVDICYRSGISSGSSSLTQTGMVDFVPGCAVTEAAQHKCVKYEAKCADI